MSEQNGMEALRARFEGVARTIGDRLAAASPRVVALVAKWSKDDLVPGLSDMDFRVVCDEATTADDWVEIDWHVGRIHRQMVTEHPEWNRINEHTAGVGINLAEVAGTRFHHPEYAVWTTWWGRSDWALALQARTLARPLSAFDEHYHLTRFLAYYSPYIHGIDPPINLGPFEPKYALHSRCWHYFAPPMLSAATILARRHFASKQEALLWLVSEGLAARPARAVLEQVEAHYDTPEQTDPGRLDRFEQLLFSGFAELLRPVVDAIEHLDLPTEWATPATLQRHLAKHIADPLVELLETVRFSRIRAGRYYFYLHAPSHFSAHQQLIQEQGWTKKLVGSTTKLLGALGADGRSAEACFQSLGLVLSEQQRGALRFMGSLAAASPADAALATEYAQATEQFPHFYRLLERALGRVCERQQIATETAVPIAPDTAVPIAPDTAVPIATETAVPTLVRIDGRDPLPAPAAVPTPAASKAMN